MFRTLERMPMLSGKNNVVSLPFTETRLSVWIKILVGRCKAKHQSYKIFYGLGKNKKKDCWNNIGGLFFWCYTFLGGSCVSLFSNFFSTRLINWVSDTSNAFAILLIMMRDGSFMPFSISEIYTWCESIASANFSWDKCFSFRSSRMVSPTSLFTWSV